MGVAKKNVLHAEVAVLVPCRNDTGPRSASSLTQTSAQGCVAGPRFEAFALEIGGDTM